MVKKMPKMGRWLWLAIALCGSVLAGFALLSSPAHAASGINQQLDFQGRLLNSQGATVPDGVYNIEFKIYQDGDGQSVGDTTGSPAGSLKWTEDHLVANSQGVTIKNGYFAVQLGSISAFGSSINWNWDTLWLSVNIANSTSSCSPFSTCSPDGEMTPMKRLTSSAYSLNSGQLGGLTSAQFIQLAQGLQTDSSNNTSIYVNKTGSGNLLDLQSGGNDAFVLDNSGNLSFGANANHTLSVATAGTGVAGKSLTLTAGGAGTGASTLAGGNLILQGGAGGGTNGNGGNIQIDAGIANGSGTDGTISIGANHASAISIAKSGVTTTVNGSTTLQGALTLNNTGYINTNSTTALLVEQNGVKSNVLDVDTTNGRVGIGTNAPASKLDIESASNDGITVRSGNASNYTYFSIGRTSEEATFAVAGGANQFLTGVAAGDTALRANGGNLYIGTTAASKGVFVRSSNNFASAFQVKNASGVDVFNVDTTNSLVGTSNQTVASTNSTALNFRTGDVTGATSNTGNLTISSGSSFTSGNTGNVSLISGNATSGTAGNLSVDVGTSSTGTPTLNVGNTNARSITIGNTTGATSVTIQGGTGTAINIGTGGIGNTIQIGTTTGAVTQTINIGNNATASSATNLVLGSTVAGTTTLQSAGGVIVSALGTANSVTYLCRNGSNIISTCQTNVTGSAFVQGGNSFGSSQDATLGTNNSDNGQLILETHGTTALTLDTSQNATFAGSITVNSTGYINTSSTNAFKVENSSGNTNVLVVNTANGLVGIGAAPTVGGNTMQVAGSITATGQLLLNSGTNANVQFGSTNLNSGSIQKSTTTGTGGISANDVVILDSSATAVDTTIAHDNRVFGVSASTCAATVTCAIITSGNTTVNASGTINIGDQLVTSTTSGRVISDNNATTGILGIALSSQVSGTGTVSVFVRPHGGVANPNVPGNLTVQGTGTSSFAGALTVTSTINNATISGGTLSGGSFSGGTVSGGTLTGSAVNGLNVSGTAIAGTGALTIDASGSNAITLGSISTGNILLAGGFGSTGCTVNNGNGNLNCDGTLNGATISGGTLSAGSFTGGSVSAGTITGGTLSATAVNGLNVSSSAIAVSTAATGLTVDAGTSGTISIGGTSTGDILLGGGSASTGCTVTNANGNFACSGTLNGATISGGTLSAGSFTGGSVSAGTISGGSLSNSAVDGLNVSGSAISASTAATFTIDASGTNAINIGGTSTGNILLGGGLGANGCTVNNGNGNLNCDGTLNGATISGGTLSSGSFSGGTVSSGTLTSSAVDNLNVSGSAISASTAATFTIDASGTNAISIGGTSTGDILLGGGSSTTGCTVTNATGDLACSGNITGAALGTIGYWTRSSGSLQPATSGDAITTSGNISTSGSGTITSAGLLSANGGLTVTGGQNITMSSGIGTYSQTYTGSVDAHTITANSLSTGTAFKVNSSNNTAANTNWSGVQFNTTNAQGTTAVTGLISGFDVQFTQNPTVAGNNETVANFAIAANSGSPTDNTVNSIINAANNDTATGNQITATNGLLIQGANVTNGINLSGTFGTNLITSSNFTVAQSGNLTAGTYNTATISGGTLTSSAVNGLSVSTNAITGGAAGTLTIDANGANGISIAGTSTGDILLGGGSSSTGCTVTNANGNFGCAGTITAPVISATTGFVISGATTVGHYLRNNGTNYVDSALNASDISGTLFTLAGSSGTSQNVTTGGTVSILKGSSNNLTTTASATNTVTVDIVNNPTFTGLLTDSSSTTGLALTGTPAASASSSLLQMGAAITSGNGSANGGTYLGINEPGSGAGSAADFLNFETNGTVKMKVTNAGALTLAGGSAGITLQNATGGSTLSFSNSDGILKVWDSSTGSPTNYALVSYSSNTAIFSASSGVTQIGQTSGNVTIPLTGSGDNFLFTKTYTPSAAYSTNEYSIRRVVTGGTNALTGNVLSVENRSTGSNDSTTVLYLNENNSSAVSTAFLLQAQSGGSTNLLTLDNSGNLNVSNGYKIGGTAGSSTACSSGQSLLGATVSGGIITGGICTADSTLQDVYTNSSSPATITTSSGKGILFADGTAGTSNLFQVQATGSLNLLTADSLDNIIQIGSATADSTQVNLALDQYNAFSDSGSCNSTADPNGSLYYNTQSNSIRACINGSWSDLASTSALGIMLFGVKPDSGNNPGDLPALATAGVSGPCKISWTSTTSVTVAPCTAYSGGRQVNVTSTTITITGMTTTNIWEHLCLTGSNNQPALSAAGSSETANMPTFSKTAPILCLADIKGSTGTANNIAQIYDTRTFTNTQKEFVTVSATAAGLGQLVMASGSNATQTGTSSDQFNVMGVVVATDGATSTTNPNAIIATQGPAYVKASAGTAGQFVQNGTTAGYAQTAGGAGFGNLGVSRLSFSGTCTSAASCIGSLYFNETISY